ncbi:putative serine esterase-domain-containing protein [Tribonema minus]|uniref:Putative serine esterase-domain-containing protein n=1 Tax=Tribonema minus TaxID=303371 RepID=A0A835YY83_9STRA|nr:putative serine esterase-domain-containing protein [Tribonema minus]
MAYLGTQIDSRYGADSYVYLSEANAGPFKTLDGIDEGGSRFFEEVMNLVERPMLRTARKISFVAHGIGGLYVRFALKRLYERGVLGGRLSPINFITFGTPHLGTLTSAAGVMGALIEGRTSAQLKLKDGDERFGRPPLLVEMCNREYVAALGRFAVRKLYANVRFDSMELYSASIRLDDPYMGLSDMQLAARITPQYTHVLVDAEDHAAANAGAGQQQRQVVAPFRPQLAGQLSDRRIWEDGAQALMDIGWLRVDIYNPKGLSPHKDLVVATVWLNKEGMDIVRHCVDTALT